MNIEFDVIIPTFNRATFLDRSISSVLNQSYSNFNLYIIDDGSTDNTKNIIEKYTSDQRVHYFYKNNGGVSSARNVGINISKSNWITFLDSDDEWLSSKLQIQKKEIEENPSIYFFHSNEIWKRNGVKVNIPKKFNKNPDSIEISSLDFCLISPSTVLINRELLQEFGGFDENIKLCEDFDLWNKILNKYQTKFCNENLIIKNAGHSDQLSYQDPLMDMWRIRSLNNLINNYSVSAKKREVIISILIKKIEVIRKGFEKYKMTRELEELNSFKDIF